MSQTFFRRESLSSYSPTKIDNLESLPQKPQFSIVQFLLIPAITIGVYLVVFSYAMKGTSNFQLFFLLSAIIGFATSIIRFISERAFWHKQCRHICEQNDAYITQLADTSIFNGANYRQEMLYCFPKLDDFSTYDWVRTSTQKSFMKLRVGLYTAHNPAALTFANDITAAAFQSVYQDVIQKTQSLPDVPYVLDLCSCKMVGIYGANKETVFNNLILNLTAFHLEDDLRVCTLCDDPLFSWCRRLPHANDDTHASLYAESVEEIYETVKLMQTLAAADDGKENVMLLTNDIFLQVKAIRELSKLPRVHFLVLCADTPPSYCDVTIGNDTVAFSKQVSSQTVKLDHLPLKISQAYIKQHGTSARGQTNTAVKRQILSEYIDGFTFFGIPATDEGGNAE